MNIVRLNTVSLDGIIKKGGSSGGGGVPINNQEKSLEITENGVTEVTADAGFTGLGKVTVNVDVPSSGGGSGWTGHADAEGLRAIGWTDEDIAYYQENGVNWNAEDDEYHKVTDDNKALYGVLTANNISSYKDRIVYLPKIDTSAKTSMSNMFYDCYSLVAIPQLDTRNVTNMSYTFSNCYALVSISRLDTSKVTNMDGMLQRCYSLTFAPPLNTENVKSCNFMLQDCYSLAIAKLNVKAKLNVVWQNCYSLKYVDAKTTIGIGDNRLFQQCYSLTDLYLSGMGSDLYLDYCPLISKESILFLINNEAATSAITIRLASYAYTRLANDADIVAALTAHPNISISQ